MASRRCVVGTVRALTELYPGDVKVLLNRRNASGLTPIQEAVLSRTPLQQIETIECLVQFGGDPTALSRDGANLFLFAVAHGGSVQLLRFLASRCKVDPKQRRATDDANALHLWAEQWKPRTDVLHCLLLEFGCDATACVGRRGKRNNKLHSRLTMTPLDVLFMMAISRRFLTVTCRAVAFDQVMMLTAAGAAICSGWDCESQEAHFFVGDTWRLTLCLWRGGE